MCWNHEHILLKHGDSEWIIGLGTEWSKGVQSALVNGTFCERVMSQNAINVLHTTPVEHHQLMCMFPGVCQYFRVWKWTIVTWHETCVSLSRYQLTTNKSSLSFCSLGSRAFIFNPACDRHRGAERECLESGLDQTCRMKSTSGLIWAQFTRGHGQSAVMNPMWSWETEAGDASLLHPARREREIMVWGAWLLTFKAY